MDFSLTRVAHTGKNMRWGTALHLLARDHKAKKIIELGACAGISACYLSSSPHCTTMMTIEGSQDLAMIAQASVNQMGNKTTVINGLFDDVLDAELPRMTDVDIAFIDGHHERSATIHYYERLKSALSSGAMVIFDDITWSKDMRQMWEEVRTSTDFSDAVDLGVIGICIYQPSERSPQQWNLASLVA